MTESDWLQTFAVAVGLWPDCRAEEGTAAAWWPHVQGFSGGVVYEAFNRLARSVERFPTLAALLTVCRELSTPRPSVPALAEPEGAPDVRVAPLPEPPDYVIGPYSQLFSQMNRTGWSREKLRVFAERVRRGDLA